MSISTQIRNKLITRARDRHARITYWTKNRPTKWWPGKVRNPEEGGDTCFTNEGAWELIAEQLEAGCEVDEIKLRKPPGNRAYVMMIDLLESKRMLYVKLELERGKIFGRSFHYSEYP